MRVLNVAEKNDAAKNIAAQLSRGGSRMREGLSRFNKIYEFQYNAFNRNCAMIMTSVAGHLMTYEFTAAYRNWLNCSPLALFDAPLMKNCPQDYQNIKRTLEREVRSCEALIVWTDCDREGENIGYEIIDTCKAIKPNLLVYRAKFSEITKRSVERAMMSLEEPNKNVSDAVDVRQQLDLRIGAAFTRFQTLRLKRVFPTALAENLISYGSCQFPTLGFVVERFKAISEFISEQFWKIKVSDTRDDLCVEFNWKRVRLFEQLACEVLYDVCRENPTATVKDVQSKPKQKWRPKPLDTVELEKLGSRKLSINAKETMRIAEKLYTQGFISYPRTETNIFPKELNLVPLVEAQTVDPNWGAFAGQVLQNGPNPFQGNKSDQAHPPIHPTKYTDGLNGNEKRIYELIVRHFLACLSKHAEGLETIVTINIADEEFSATGLMIIARNYLDVYPYDKWNAKEIHIYQKGDRFNPVIEMVDGSTSPPNLLTEADLIALMEKHGIGTDATHADHIETIKARLYVGLRDNKFFVPRTLGMGLVEGYDSMGFAMSKPNLRAELEADLKRICDGQKDPEVVLREQLAKYKSVFEAAQAHVEQLDAAVGRHLQLDAQPVHGEPEGYTPMKVVMKCPSCGSDMCLRSRKTGEGKYVSCNSFPGCKTAFWFPSMVQQVDVLTDTCPQCGPNTFQLQFKFERGSCYLPTNYTGCIGGCDSNLVELLGIQRPRIQDTQRPRTQDIQRPRIQNTPRDILQPVSSNTGEDSGFVSRNTSASFRSDRVTNRVPRTPSADDVDLPCKCNRPAVKLTVKKQGPNQGRTFYKCGAPAGEGGCNFFKWADEVTTQQQSTVVEHGGVTHSAQDDLNCHCAIPSRLLTVQKEGPNMGRKFYACSKNMSDPEKCGFFKWADETDNDQRNERPQFSNRNDSFGRGGGGSSSSGNNSNFGSKRRWMSGAQQQPKRRKCGLCGQEGHNRKNCSNR